jgi:hypothetical protein
MLQRLWENAKSILPTVGMVIAVVLAMATARRILASPYAGKSGSKYRLQIAMPVLFFVGLISVILVLPLSSNLKEQLLSLIGILLSAAIALSATTFAGNAMAGTIRVPGPAFGSAATASPRSCTASLPYDVLTT